MDIVGTSLSAAQNLNDALQYWENFTNLFSYESELKDLQKTVERITAVLRDAETKLELSNEAKVVIKDLKDAFFDADDLVDEIVTRAHLQKQLDSDGTLLDKVRDFFSTSNPICVSYWMSRGIKDIKKKLDAISYNNQFSLKHDPEPIRKRRPDTCSYVDEVGIIGREDDLEEIVGRLLHPSDDQRHNMSFLSVVGIGGLGKTALAQLVYNDPRVTSAFSWRKWTCVADQDQKQLDVKEVLCKILDDRQDSYMETVQNQLREKLAGNKYLLVLDDVWTEDCNQWRNLVKYFMGGQKGSWIVVTTRSHETAKMVDGDQVYELQGLSRENSWSLFEQTAFTSGQSSNPPNELVEIGQKIVGGCAGVPLAIRVAGSLLYGQDRSKWQSVQEIGLANIRECKNGILPILKLSFYNLESPLKSCFAYCSLFPKDFWIEKEKLKSLWMAQGYVVPFDRGQSIEDACEEYFSILLKRCFFQDILKDDFGEVDSFKIHDLMHDIALYVAGEEILYATKTVTENLNERVRHLSVANMEKNGNYSVLRRSHIRSHLHFYSNIGRDTQYSVEAFVKNCMRVRALDLSRLRIQSLPDCIGDLLHLRYLDLSNNEDLQVLPKSFLKLCNLETLYLYDCKSLRELPKDLIRLVKLRLLNLRDCISFRELPGDLSRLVNLRLLNVNNCFELKQMPMGMGKLTNLHWLSHFKVGGGGSSSNWKQWFDRLEDLKALNKLKGSLNIEIKWPKKDKNNVKENDDTREGSYLINKAHLNELYVYFLHEEGDDGGKDEELRLMEDLQPHSNLKILIVWDYKGVKMPGWLTLLPNIVKLHLWRCSELEYLPCLGSLRHLKSIELEYLENMEYIGVDDTDPDPSWAINCISDKVHSFFPSLKEVLLLCLPKLKGWKRGQVEDNNYNSGNNLQQLQHLKISNCPELTCLPSCPRLESLQLWGFNKGLQITTDKKKKRDEEDASKLRSVEVDNMAWLNTLPLEFFHCLIKLKIRIGNEEEEVNDLPNWMQFLPALQTLRIDNSKALKAIPNWMPKLTSLTTLELNECSESLKRRCQKDPPGEDWPLIHHIPDFRIR